MDMVTGEYHMRGLIMSRGYGRGENICVIICVDLGQYRYTVIYGFLAEPELTGMLFEPAGTNR